MMKLAPWLHVPPKESFSRCWLLSLPCSALSFAFASALFSPVSVPRRRVGVSCIARAVTRKGEKQAALSRQRQQQAADSNASTDVVVAFRPRPSCISLLSFSRSPVFLRQSAVCGRVTAHDRTRRSITLSTSLQSRPFAPSAMAHYAAAAPGGAMLYDPSMIAAGGVYMPISMQHAAMQQQQHHPMQPATAMQPSAQQQSTAQAAPPQHAASSSVVSKSKSGSGVNSGGAASSEGGESAAAASSSVAPVKKGRKPYTITKPREAWTKEEHDSFLEALQLSERTRHTSDKQPRMNALSTLHA